MFQAGAPTFPREEGVDGGGRVCCFGVFEANEYALEDRHVDFWIEAHAEVHEFWRVIEAAHAHPHSVMEGAHTEFPGIGFIGEPKAAVVVVGCGSEELHGSLRSGWPHQLFISSFL